MICSPFRTLVHENLHSVACCNIKFVAIYVCCNITIVALCVCVRACVCVFGCCCCCCCVYVRGCNNSSCAEEWLFLAEHRRVIIINKSVESEKLYLKIAAKVQEIVAR